MRLITVVAIYVHYVEPADDVKSIWECQKRDLCVRNFDDRLGPRDSLPQKFHLSYAACQLVCGAYSKMVPKPTNADAFVLYPTYDSINVDYVLNPFQEFKSEGLTTNWNNFLANLERTCGNMCIKPSGKRLSIVVKEITKNQTSSKNWIIDRTGSWQMDESYDLKIESVKDARGENFVEVHLRAATEVGIYRALATLIQLTAPIYKSNGVEVVMLNDVEIINDVPRKSHRGLIVDLVEHRVTIDDIKEIMNSMSGVKLNILHIHVSFDRYDKNGNAYDSKFLNDVQEYGSLLGIIVIYELKRPKKDVEVLERPKNCKCINVCYANDVGNPVKMCGRTGVRDYGTLQKFFSEAKPINDRNRYFHLDTNAAETTCSGSFRHLYNKDNVVSWNKMKVVGEWSESMKKQADAAKTALNLSVWQPFFAWSGEPVSPDNYRTYVDPEKFIIQTWNNDNSLIPGLTRNGYRVISTIGRHTYLNESEDTSTDYEWIDGCERINCNGEKGLIGGEAIVPGNFWKSQQSDSSIKSRRFIAAAAETLWSGSCEPEKIMNSKLDILIPRISDIYTVVTVNHSKGIIAITQQPYTPNHEQQVHEQPQTYDNRNRNQQQVNNNDRNINQRQQAEGNQFRQQQAQDSRSREQQANQNNNRGQQQVNNDRNINQQQANDNRIRQQQANDDRIRQQRADDDRIRQQQANDNHIRQQQTNDDRIRQERADDDRIRQQQAHDDRIRQQRADDDRIRQQQANDDRIRQQQAHDSKNREKQAHDSKNREKQAKNNNNRIQPVHEQPQTYDNRNRNQQIHDNQMPENLAEDPCCDE